MRCDQCGRFMSEPAEVMPVKDSVHPYTADYWYLCAHCVEELALKQSTANSVETFEREGR